MKYLAVVFFFALSPYQAISARWPWTGLRMLQAMFAMPILVFARAMPMVRIVSAMACFWTAKTCLTGARCLERVALPRRMWGGIGLPGLRRRWMWPTGPTRSTKASFFLER